MRRHKRRAEDIIIGLDSIRVKGSPLRGNPIPSLRIRTFCALNLRIRDALPALSGDPSTPPREAILSSRHGHQIIACIPRRAARNRHMSDHRHPPSLTPTDLLLLRRMPPLQPRPWLRRHLPPRRLTTAPEHPLYQRCHRRQPKTQLAVTAINPRPFLLPPPLSALTIPAYAAVAGPALSRQRFSFHKARPSHE
jgi:hypothetical protein